MGVNLSEETTQAKELTVGFCSSFAKHYAKAYVLGIMKQNKKIAEKEAKGNPWKLMKCDKEPDEEPKMTGTLKRRTSILKKWKDQFFVVKANYLIDYYENEEKYKAGAKPEGTINMSNLRVNDDPNNTLMKRLTDLAAKVNMDLSALPKPEQLPDFSIEFFHPQRDPVYVQCANAEEHKQWSKIFHKCYYWAPSLNITDDSIHPGAFNNALWRARWENDMWGGWWWGGGEIGILSDTMNDKLADIVLSKVDSKLNMGWFVRSRIRNGFMKSTSAMVTATVTPCWTAAYEGVKKVKPTLADKLKELCDPINQAQIELQKKICSEVESKSKDTMNKEVAPKLAPLAEILFAPILEAYKFIIEAFDENIAKGKEGFKPQEDCLYMVWHHSYNHKLWDAESRIYDMYDPLWDMHTVFSDISPWGVCRKACRRLRKLNRNVLFTFENYLKDGLNWDDAAKSAREKLIEDCRTAVIKTLARMLYDVCDRGFEKLVVTPCRKLVQPMADAIPDAVKDFCDPEEMLEEVLFAILKTFCKAVFDPFISKVQF